MRNIDRRMRYHERKGGHAMIEHMRYRTLRARRLEEQAEEVAERLKAQRAYWLQGDLAQIFYDQRKELGYTQAEAASRCGIAQAKVSIIEGSAAHPPPALVEKISRGLERRPSRSSTTGRRTTRAALFPRQRRVPPDGQRPSTPASVPAQIGPYVRNVGTCRFTRQP